MAACLRCRRRLPLSPPAAPLEDDGLLSENLLRLPPQPSSLPRASAVCSRLLSDPAFRRRFRIHHRGSALLLGSFIHYPGITFQPAPDAPDRLPLEQFRLKLDDHYIALGCRHGLALFFLPIRLQVLVWDPLAGHQLRLAVPPDFEFQGAKGDISGAVLRAAGDVDHFRVVLVGCDGEQPRTALACVYSSETGVWGGCVSTPIPSEGLFIFRGEPAMLAGDRLHWSVTVAGSRGILKFDLDRQSLDLSLLPGDYYTPLSPEFTVVRAEGGRMGFLFLHRFIAELWSTKRNRDGVEIWTPGRSIELDKLLGLNSEKEPPQMIGYAEENNAVFFRAADADYMVHLESLQFNKLPKTTVGSYYHPFETVHTPEPGSELAARGLLPSLVVRAEGGGKGFLFLYRFTAELWSTKRNRDGVEIWAPGRSIELDKLLGLNSEKEPPQMIGYAEENNAVLFRTVDADYMVHLESLQFNKLPKTTVGSYYHPFETVHTPVPSLRWRIKFWLCPLYNCNFGCHIPH
ncbi:uncharacterized protein [Aegilops tauschii subsp. strangulata]|nr:uncharacterized protein LOC109737531 isoform X1 [Aegilops tauschii subsp. strangulata]XP_044418148.1 uncharacterized protein LOC123143332 isoform X1 [Triticum aestivum]